MSPEDLSPNTRLLFVAMSRNQAGYYQDLIEHMGVNGCVVLAKHPGYGSPLRALRWIRRRGVKANDWLAFRLQKAKANGESVGVLSRWGLILRTLHFLDALVRKIDRFKPDALVVWNGAHYKQQAAISYCAANKLQVIYLELGYLPNTMAVDGCGVNYSNSLPREANFYRRYQPQADSLIKQLVGRPPRTPVGEEIALPEHYIFVPFQVYDDTQVLVHSPWVRSMEEFYRLLLDSVDVLPESWCYVVKEHPTSTRSYPELHKVHPRIVFANANNTQELIENSELVITINSTVGIEALLLGRPVITVGNACYNIEGLVHHADSLKTFRALLGGEAYRYDRNLVEHFMAYLNEQYLVPGRPRNKERLLDSRHYQVMAERIRDILGRQL